jgi:hypothetical protein
LALKTARASDCKEALAVPRIGCAGGIDAVGLLGQQFGRQLRYVVKRARV